MNRLSCIYLYGLVSRCYYNSYCGVSAHADELYVFVTEWGSCGDEDGQFDYAQGIAVDSSGYVYVADSNSKHPEIRCLRHLHH